VGSSDDPDRDAGVDVQALGNRATTRARRPGARKRRVDQRAFEGGGAADALPAHVGEPCAGEHAWEEVITQCEPGAVDRFAVVFGRWPVAVHSPQPIPSLVRHAKRAAPPFTRRRRARRCGRAWTSGSRTRKQVGFVQCRAHPAQRTREENPGQGPGPSSGDELRNAAQECNASAALWSPSSRVVFLAGRLLGRGLTAPAPSSRPSSLAGAFLAAALRPEEDRVLERLQRRECARRRAFAATLTCSPVAGFTRHARRDGRCERNLAKPEIATSSTGCDRRSDQVR